MPQFVDLRDRYTVLLESLEVSPGHRAAVEQRATAIVVAQRRYEKVSETTRIPWFVIAALHSVVTNLNFKAHLHNGDSLSARTVHEPRDRPLDDRFHETTQLHLGLSVHGMRPLRASHMIRTLEALD